MENVGVIIMKTILSLKNVIKTYPVGENNISIIKNMNLNIYEGEFIAIQGPSGSGKSTLLYILAGMIKADSGDILFKDIYMNNIDSTDRAILRKENFGFIFQSYNLIDNYTVIENVMLPILYSGNNYNKLLDYAIELLKYLGLYEYINYKPNQLSGGQQQRVAIARALMTSPNIIFADEPTGALDTNNAYEIMNFLKKLNDKGHTIIVVTHDEKISSFAKRKIKLIDGKIVNDDFVNKNILTETKNTYSGSILDNRKTYLINILLMAFRSLKSAKLSTILSLLGIIIGVASVMIVLALGKAGQETVENILSSVGGDKLIIRPGYPNIRGSSNLVTTLTNYDLQILNNIYGVDSSLGSNIGNIVIRYSNKDCFSKIIAASYTFCDVQNWEINKGNFFTNEDVISYAPVAIIGNSISKKLFDFDDPLGKWILINNKPFIVIGIFKEKGVNAMGLDQDDIVVIPLSTGQMFVFGKKWLDTISLKISNKLLMNSIKYIAKEHLLSIHKEEDFVIHNMTEIIDATNSSQKALTLLLTSIAAISLIVGGIGVMNTMLTSVAERIHEIGIRLTVGALPIDISLQFIFESIIKCLLGGFLGVLIAMVMIYLSSFFQIPMKLTINSILISVLSTALIGIFFGIFPARKASLLDPLQALNKI